VSTTRCGVWGVFSQRTEEGGREYGYRRVFVQTERIHLKKFRLLALFAVLIAAVCVTASVAVAGNNATTTQWKASYDLPGLGGHWECSGARIVKDAPKAFIKDSETCTFSDLSTYFAPGTYTQADFGWLSDYEYFVLSPSSNRLATSHTTLITDNGDGTGTLQISAYYN
jgi:hypothetical protein